jgi:flavorubredoxin
MTPCRHANSGEAELLTFVLEQVAPGSVLRARFRARLGTKEMVIMEQTPLTALVVYESFFGNTRTIAQAVAEGLRSEGVRPTVQDVSMAAPADVAGYPCWWWAAPRTPSA